MPGIGVRTGARILLEVGDGSGFPTPGHLAAYVGIAPVTHRSGAPPYAVNFPLAQATTSSNAPCSWRRSRPTRPVQPRPLRAKTRRGQETQRRPYLPCPTTLRHHLRDTQDQAALPHSCLRYRLTGTIGTPPTGWPPVPGYSFRQASTVSAVAGSATPAGRTTAPAVTRQRPTTRRASHRTSRLSQPRR